MRKENMVVTSIKTHKITKRDIDLLQILDRYLPPLRERSVVVITSKIVAICEGRTVKIDDADKDKLRDKLIEQEAEYFLPKEENKWGFHLTITNGIIIASSGIDESNGNGYYVLWPKNPQQSANAIRKFLVSRHKLQDVGVIITDSRISPLRRGVTGVAIAHSGFSALNNYIGKPDIFGHHLRVTKANIADALASAAVVVIGEGREQTPLSVITDVSFVKFQRRNPAKRELADLKIPLDEDIFASLLKRAPWKKGKGSR